MDENRDLFTRFLAFVKEVTHCDSEVLALLEKRHTKANPHFTSSTRFAQLVRTTRKNIQKDEDNKFVFLKELSDELKAYDSKHLTKLKKKKLTVSDSDTSEAVSVASWTERNVLSKEDQLHKTENGDCDSKIMDPSETKKRRITPQNVLLHNMSSEPDRKTEALAQADEIVFMDFTPNLKGNDNHKNGSVETACTNDDVIELLSDEELNAVSLPRETSHEKNGISTAQSESDLPDLIEEDSDFQDPVPSTSKVPGKENDSLKEILTVKQKKIQKYEDYLAKVDRKIKRLDAKEINLNDLEADATYLQIDKLKKRYVDHWKRLCELQGRDQTTGRPIEKAFRCPGASQFPQINKRIEKFINKQKEFPDFGDIHSIVTNCNIRFSLRLKKTQVDLIARDALSVVGNKLQKRRQDDFKNTTTTHLTENLVDLDDPALCDFELRRKLEANQRKSKNNLDAVIRKYALKQQREGDEEDDDDEENEQDDQINQEEKELLEIQSSNDKDEERSSPKSCQGEIKKVSYKSARFDHVKSQVARRTPQHCSPFRVESTKQGQGGAAGREIAKTGDHETNESFPANVQETTSSTKAILAGAVFTRETWYGVHERKPMKETVEAHENTGTKHAVDTTIVSISDDEASPLPNPHAHAGMFQPTTSKATSRLEVETVTSPQNTPFVQFEILDDLGCYPLDPECETNCPPLKKAKLGIQEPDTTTGPIEVAETSTVVDKETESCRVSPECQVRESSTVPEEQASKKESHLSLPHDVDDSSALTSSWATPAKEDPSSVPSLLSLRQAADQLQSARKRRLSRKRKREPSVTDVVVVEEDSDSKQSTQPAEHSKKKSPTKDLLPSASNADTGVKQSSATGSKPANYSYKKVHTVVKTTSVLSDPSSSPRTETVVRGSYKTVIKNSPVNDLPGTVVSESTRKESTVEKSTYRSEKSAPSGFRRVLRKKPVNLNVDLKVSDSARKGVQDLAAKMLRHSNILPKSRNNDAIKDGSQQGSSHAPIPKCHEHRTNPSVELTVPTFQDSVIVLSDSD